MLRTRSLLLVLVALAAVVAPVGSVGAATTPTANRTDAIFAAQMLPHHRGGIKLGKLAAKRGQDPEIRSLGAKIVAEQTPEEKRLARMVRQFKTASVQAPEIKKRDALDMKKLENASAADFDRMWLDVISSHHMSAIQMATMEVRGGKNPNARSLAKSIVSTQRRELARFNTLTEKLG